MQSSAYKKNNYDIFQKYFNKDEYSEVEMKCKEIE